VYRPLLSSRYPVDKKNIRNATRGGGEYKPKQTMKNNIKTKFICMYK
jgi:hypothetical protein